MFHFAELCSAGQKRKCHSEHLHLYHSEHSFLVIPNVARNPVHGCFTSFSMTNRVAGFSMLDELICPRQNNSSETP